MSAEKVVIKKSSAEVLDAATEEARRMDAYLSVRLQTVGEKVRALSRAFADVIDRLIAVGTPARRAHAASPTRRAVS
jgi:hypothetical protein